MNCLRDNRSDFLCGDELGNHQNLHEGQKPMKMEVTFYVGGKTWKETYEVNNRQDAKRTAESRNPTAKIIALNPVY